MNQIRTRKPWGLTSGLFCLYAIISILLLSSSITAQGHFNFTPECRQAYDAALSLRFDEAREKCQQIKWEDPENLIVYLVEDYIDFFTVFINEKYDEFNRLEKNKDFRLQKIRNGDTRSPYYRFCQAEINLHWALARLKFEEYFSAFLEIKNAYKLLNNNQEVFPNFIANKKSLGILHAMIGTVPDSYKWGVKLLGGMEGTIEQGQQEIEEVILFSKSNDFIFREEVGVLYSYLMLHLKNNADRAWRNIQEINLDHKNNPLAAFALGNIAMRTSNNDLAIQFLEERPKGSDFASFPYLDYMLGLAKLFRQDPDASLFLQKYIDQFHGVNYIKEAYQKIAWQCLINDDLNCYKKNMEACAKYGGSLIGGDKMAMREAEGGITPEPTLLKSRLLFDGGYYQQAADVLNKKGREYFTSNNRLEFLYRLGRIYQQSGKSKLAKLNYKETILEGSSSPKYYACNAALQLGIIYENEGDYSEARKFFTTCLEIRPREYKSSIHQKAKAGINRLPKSKSSLNR